ncbi:peptidylprolyl isomerase [Granulicella sp. S156]|jgi:peptidyl-prolyl cis-trans isomerase SurA|uniref:peptidylprolyl isomerase n=1 Tax=Granulicella sp. S156 TaxID=1747224 RepID=UPI00131B5B2E|nr:peptidylprolyl isomerase [Granulicella sp. S156]
MNRTHTLDTLRHSAFALLLVAVCVAPGELWAQSAAQKNSVPQTAPELQVAAPQMPTTQGTELDRVVAIVNGDLILDSDVNEETRLQAFQPYRNPNADNSRERAIERLINRDLILQQLKIQPEDPITDDDVRKDLDSLRKNIPACKPYDCETQAGWEKFLAANGFTEATLINRWRLRMEVLAFIEERFRMGMKILPADIKDYYDKDLLPEYAKQKATPPSLDSISSRIQEVLLQQRVSSLLNDWLKSLRAQGSVVVLHPGEGAP